MSRLQKMSRTFSGIQPTGTLHLGNYFGAVRRWVDASKDAKASGLQPHQNIFSIVDLHAITMPGQKPEDLRRNILKMTSSLLACGLDTDNSVLFLQSSVPHHTELSWILTCLTTMSQLNGLSQYKDKSAAMKEIPVGLYMYPVLQSADILLYKGTHVPVGEDNVQNVELSRRLARKFNSAYKVDFFSAPKVVLIESAAAKVKSLRDPSKKMSKSDPDTKSCIYVDDSDETIVEKCKKAVADSNPEMFYEPEGRPGVSNLISIHSEFTGASPDEITRQVKGMNTIQYKLHLADVIIESLRPIRTRIEELEKDPEFVYHVLEAGNEKANFMAEETMREVKRIVGLSRC